MIDGTVLRNYIIGAVIIWVGVIASAAVILRGTDEFAGMLIVLSAGAVWFVVLVPGWLRTLNDRRKRP
jgi:hypothetical protein